MLRNLMNTLGVGLGAATIAIVSFYSFWDSEEPHANGLGLSTQPTSPALAVARDGPLVAASAGREADATATLQDQMAVMQTTLAALTEEISLLKARRSEAKESEDGQGQARDEGVEVQRTPDQTAREDDQLFLAMETNFAAQSVDRGWSDTARQSIEAALSDEHTRGLNVDYIDCRTKVCKLEMGQLDESNMAAFREHFREQVAEVFGAGMVRQNESGKMVVFLAEDSADFEVTAVDAQ